MREIKIGDRWVGDNHKPFVIAEMSANHNQDLGRALKLVQAAAESGAHALKLQTSKPELITLNHRGGLFDITDKNSLWYGKNLYELYKLTYTPWEWHKEIFEYSKSLGMLAFSSPFDETAVDFLMNLEVPAFKIASFESNHYPLLKKVAQTGKPILISSGTSKLSELYDSVNYLKECGAKDIIIFKCTSTYPASPENTNLRTIPVFQSVFEDCVIGLSDHTMGIGAAVGAVAMGARVIEKHFTLNRADGGVDSSFSLEPDELKALVIETERAYLSMGGVQLDTQKIEKTSRQFKRSIYVSKDILKGELLTPQNLAIIRPGDGMHPKHWEAIMNSEAQRDYKFGTPFSL